MREAVGRAAAARRAGRRGPAVAGLRLLRHVRDYEHRGDVFTEEVRALPEP